MLEVAEKDILHSLERDNPWWAMTPNMDMDKKFPHRRAYFKEFRDLAFNWNVRRSIILMGPRRVGKTVMLQQLISDTIKEGVLPNSILFVSIDTPLYSGMPLQRLLDLFHKQTGCDPDGRRLIIFDEIQYLRDWEVHLKVLTDQFPNTRFVASGSAAAALRLKSQESGAGRFTDFFLPPLTFSEFLDFSQLEQTLISETYNGRTKRYQAGDITALNSAFVDYINYGGYPEAVLNPEVRTNTQRYLGRDIVDKVLLRDLPSLYGIQDIQELNRLFSTIAYHTGQEISLEKLASSSGVAKNTISRYLEYLEAAFLIVRVTRVDNAGQTFQRMRTFKVYLTNPSMRSALFAPVGADDDAMGNLAETAIFSQWFHSEEIRHLHYARWKSGRTDLEVDLVKVDPATLRPVWAYEIKWSDRYVDQPGELRGLIALASKKEKFPVQVGATTRTLSSETTLDGITIRHFPCALHCYQIGKNLTSGLPA